MTTQTVPTTRTGTGGLVRYITGAVLARTADAGSAIGLLLLCVQPDSGLPRPLFVGALLAAALTAPHLLGPLLAHRLDLARDGRRLLAAAMLGYGVFLATGAVGLGRLPLPAVIACVALAGICGPMVTGGLGSRLVGIVGDEPRRRRRGEGWDAVTYGLSGSLGPAAVAAVAVATSPLTALLALAVLAVAAAVVTLTLPRTARHPGSEPGVLRTRDVLRTLAGYGPLRRVTYATLVTALTLGAMSVLAIRLAEQLGRGSAVGATLVTAFGVGNLLGSLAVTARPLRGEPEVLTAVFVAVTGGGMVLCAASPSVPVALVAFGLTGAANAAFFTATLSSRNTYAPAGGHAQVMVTSAGLKIAAGSAGTALAGTLTGSSPRLVLVLAGALLVMTAGATVLDRRAGGPSL